ncbi:MAG: glucose/sorbosone dehydrogenase [Fibrobacteria bacterium]|jgi:type 1 glutamine amidotransferase|nr:glucose/sorbosone dehydrogenase [Fibrobacteria bacterium]
MIHLRVRACRAAWFCLAGFFGFCYNLAAGQGPRVLIFHKQNGYIHTATPGVVTALKSDWAQHGFTVESTVDSLAFTAQNLARFDVVVFLNTNYRNAPLLTRAQEAAFENYLRAGGAFVGLHSAVPLNGAYEETVWPWYADLFGARFRSHAPYRSAPLVLEDRTHASTLGLPARITLQDEWYAVQANPRNVPGIHVIATVDETGFLADSYMGDHPMTWCRTFEGARSWMTLVGHDMGAFSNSDFMTHVRNGVLWAATDSAATALRAPRSEVRGKKRTIALSYAGKGGERLEVYLDGRSVAARRRPGPATR